MTNLVLTDRDGKTIPLSNLKEIRHDSFEGEVIVTDFNSFKKYDHENYIFIGESRTVNIQGSDIKSIIFDKGDN